VTPTNHRLKYLAWLLPAAALGLSLSASGAEVAQRGQPPVASTGQATAPATPAQVGSNRSGPPQPRPGSGWGEWWKDELVVKELQLTPAKAKRIDQIFMDRSKRVATIADELPVERKKLEQMVSERTADESAFALQVAKVSFLQARTWENRQVMLYRMYQELTLEQHKKLLEIQERYRGRGGRGSHY
jgi:Spy/CpxP family protein refolding chaperone